MGNPGFPMPPPAGGSGRAQPSQEQPYVHCGVVRRSRMDGCGDHRAQGSAPLPASPRWGETAREKTGFPLALRMRAGGPRTHAPAPGKVRAQPVRRGLGKPGFPVRSPGGRVWAGKALLRRPPPPSPAPAGGGNRAPPPSGGRLGGGKPGFPSPCGCGPEARAPTPPPPGRCERSPCAGAWGNRVSPRPPPAGGCGRAKPSQAPPSCSCAALPPRAPRPVLLYSKLH